MSNYVNVAEKSSKRRNKNWPWDKATGDFEIIVLVLLKTQLDIGLKRE